MADEKIKRFDGHALGTRVQLLRELRDMTLQEVADAAGLTKSHVWEMEKGKSVNPTVNAVWGLAEAFSVSPAMLLGIDDKLPPLEPFAMKIAGIISREMRKLQVIGQIELHGEPMACLQRLGQEFDGAQEENQ